MRYLLSISAFFLLLISSVSCEADIQFVPQDPVEGVVLRAIYVGGSDTRTVIDNLTTSHSAAEIMWSAGDSLSLFYMSGDPAELVNDRYVTGATTKMDAIFYPDPPVVPSEGPFLGLYPYNKEATANVDGNSIVSVIPATQTAIAGTFDPKAMIAVGRSASLDAMSFYNICSGLCFSVGADAANYSRIVFKGCANEKIAGKVNIAVGTTNSPSASAVAAEAATEIELLPVGGAFAADKDYYFVFLPGSFHSGFSLEFYGDTGGLLFTRTCSSPVQFTKGRFAYITEADADGKLAAIRSGTDLSTSKGPANCYVVSSKGTYRFPLVKGNDSKQKLDDATRVVVLWETDNTTANQTEGSIVTNLSLNKGYAYFDTPATLKNGNALIAAVHDEGQETTILWSWHIWVCSGYNPQTSAQKLNGKTLKIMDRNIGALSAAPNETLSNGLFYQWGRKDPFAGTYQANISSSPTTGTFFKLTAPRQTVVSETEKPTVDYAVAHPTTFITASDGNWLRTNQKTLWAATKTIYDPCPPGWKVPETSAWTNVDYRRTGNSTRGFGLYLRLDDTDPDTWFPNSAVWFPNNGYVSVGGSLLMVAQYACYWSSNISGNYSQALELSQNGVGSQLTYTMTPNQTKKRVEAYSVRCIEDK